LNYIRPSLNNHSIKKKLTTIINNKRTNETIHKQCQNSNRTISGVAGNQEWKYQKQCWK